MLIPVDVNRYERNLKFWEDAWQRVKNPVTQIPDALAYVRDIPQVFAKYQSKHILDLACGSGWLSFYLNEHGFEVTGVDISKSAIALAERLLDERVSSRTAKFFDDSLPAEKIDLSQIHFIEGDIFAMNFAENSFDGILINAAFEHLDYSRGASFIKQIKTFLKPGGIMFGVFDHVATGSRGEFEVLEDGTHQYFDKFRDGMFLRNYTDEEIKDLLVSNFWDIISLDYNEHGSRIVIASNNK